VVGRCRQVSVLLHGGLGNQLFQLAAAQRLIEQRSDQECHLLLLSYGNEWGPDHPDISRLLGLPITYPNRRLRTTIPGISVRESWKDSVSSVIGGVIGRLRNIQVIRQTDPYGPAIDSTRGDIVLDGFFQHPDWWLPSWSRVASSIFQRAPRGFADLCSEQRTVIKLRRSDYLGRGIALTDNYYQRAIDTLGIRNRVVTVICEDREAASDIQPMLAAAECSIREPEPITGDPNVDDFWHLAAAQTQVLANSSYCWWAAAVASMTNVHAVIAYPDPWLPNVWGAGRVPDMGIAGWIRVPAEFA